jgi:pilus assembly protein Flp/PilA
MRKQLLAFLRDEEGLTMVEYAIAGALVAAGAATAFSALGTAVFNKITELVSWVSTGKAG